MHSGTGRRLAEKQDRREAILDTAEQIYARYGWEKLTVEEVARSAGMSRPLLYTHFCTKTDLHLALIERALRLVYRRFMEARAAHCLGLDQVQAMAQTFARLAIDHRAYFEACLRYHALPAREAADSANKVACLRRQARILDALAAAIAAGQSDGSICDTLGDPCIVAVSLWSFMNGSFRTAGQASMLIRHMLQRSSISK
jgi:AcrR family transcriptional regulator